MAYRFKHMLMLPLRSVVAKKARTTWRIGRSYCTCFVMAAQSESKQCKPNHRICLAEERGFMLTSKRGQKTLSSQFGADLPSVKQMEHFLSNRKILFEHGHTSLIANCPFCAEIAKDDEGKEKPKAFTLYINKTTGSHFCRNCSASGTWQKFKVSFQKNQNQESNKSSLQENYSESTAGLASQMWENSTSLMNCTADMWEKFVTQFPVKVLRKDILEKFQVRFTERKVKGPDGKTNKHDCVLFPWYDANKSTVKGVKLVKLDVNTSDSSFTVEPRHGFLGLFGWNTVDPEAKEVVLTSTEFDAIAVNQATSYPAISLPLGTNSLPPEVLPQLEQFERIILWFGNDVISRQAANQFSRKLNPKRCFLVRPTGDSSPASALDALNSGCDLTSLVSSAQAISHEKITTFHQLRGEVFNQFVNADQVAGVKWTRFPQLTNILKGLRRGEVTVFTGPTGAGKTTLLSEMSLDLCMQGVNTLWGSFEIRNVRLVKIMLCQYSGLDLEKNIEQFQYWADKFEMLPMYLMCFYGAQNINTVIDTMSHAAYVYDIEHIIVDNLQFMTSFLSRGDDKFSAQNHVIAALRNFASTKNVHVTLVIHPRKENDDVELQTASIFGTAKASQEADNVIILQNKKGTAQKYLQVTKNRFDGVLGRVPLEFVRESLSMSGFGKKLQPNKPFNFNNRRPEKLKATRLTADVDVVKFSAPKIVGSNKMVYKNTVLPNPANKDNLDDISSNDDAASTANTQLPVSVEYKLNTQSKVSAELNNAAKMAEGPSDGAINEKKETVQRTVKKILSGTRLFTKAVHARPRNSYNKSESSQENRKPNTTKIY